MTLRVATFAATDRMLDASLRIQARMTRMQLQEASGTEATRYGEFGADSRRLITFQTSLARSEAYSSAISEADGRITALSSALSDVTDLLTDFRTQIVSAQSTDGGADALASLTANAGSSLDELASILNTRYEGRYLFAGSRTDTAPVDLDGYAADLETASTGYYAGDGVLASVRASSELTLTYGVAGDDPAFEQAIRALGALAGATDTPDADALSSAYALVGSALDDTIALQGGLSSASSSLARLATWQDEYRDMLSTSISAIRDVDVAAVTVMLTTCQTQLEASYAALAKIMSLSLQDFL